MSRYDLTNVIKTNLGKRYLRTNRYPIITRSSADIYIVGREGDRLDNLANRYYGDSNLWWIIAQANGIKGFTALYPNNFKGQLRIPTQIQDGI